MREVTAAGHMFSRVLKIRSPVLHGMMGSVGKDVWHQVQISCARDPISYEYVYIVAQVRPLCMHRTRWPQ